MLNAKSVKTTIVLDPSEVAGLSAPEGKQFKMKVRYQGTLVEVPLSGKGVRKAISAVKELGADGVAIIVQGRLKIGLTSLSLEAAGILAQPRSKKEVPTLEQENAA
jgi:hypothetical protein